MQMTFHDRAPLEKVRRLADGRIAAVAKFARSGCYTYAGSEVGRPDLGTVTVYRPESEVFDEAAMASFAHKAITVGHPVGAVTADNWKQHSAGWTEGKVARDGEYVEIPLMLADAAAVRTYESGEARELSAGYTCELTWGDGVAPDGTRYQATQRRLRGNHIALVPAGRAGGECRIGDSGAAVDPSLSNANAIRAVTGRSPRSIDPRLQAISDQAARDHAEKMRQNDAAVQAAIERYAPRSGITVDGVPLAAGAAVRDAARQVQYQTSAAPASSTTPSPSDEASAAAVRDAARAAAYGG